MRIATIGVSPFTLVSKGKLNAMILKELYGNHDLVSFVWGHDSNYYVPDEDGHFYYPCEQGKIEICPFKMRLATTDVYDLIQKHQPEIVITIGDISDFMYMQAIKMFFPAEKLKWLFVLVASTTLVNPVSAPLLQYADAILCTNEHTCKAIAEHFPKPLLDFAFVGPGISISPTESKDSGFRLMSNCKRTSTDNLAMIVETVKTIHDDDPTVSLYAHTNVHEIVPEMLGDYDAVYLVDRFDAEDFVKLPERYVSTTDGLTETELSAAYCQADIFISVPLAAPTCMTVYEALRAGCWPILNNCDSYREVAAVLEKEFRGELVQMDFLVDSIPIMTNSGAYIYIPDSRDLKRKIVKAKQELEIKKGLRTIFREISIRYDREKFLKKVVQMLEQVNCSGPTICLETM